MDLIFWLHENSHTTDARKILIYEKLDSEKIFRALNHGGLGYCQLAPWKTGDFAKTVIDTEKTVAGGQSWTMLAAPC